MPRSPEHKRVELLVTPEQYHVLKEWAGTLSVAEAVRRLLTQQVPRMAEQPRIIEQGKYTRK